MLLQFQYENYGQKLEIPVPPKTSKAVWQAVQIENREEIDRLIRQPPSRSRKGRGSG